MNSEAALLRYVLRLGDSVLILAQRLVEIVAAGPELEEELANANFALDYLGQARMFYSLAGELEGQGRGEDDFAFGRSDREFENLLLVEQPNGHFGDVIVRGVLFDTFYLLQLDALANCGHAGLAEIAARAAREIRYHLRHGAQWLVRLGDGTDESHRRVQASLDRLWTYTGEMFAGDATDDAFRAAYDGPDLSVIQAAWTDQVHALLNEANLRLPDEQWMAGGGKRGVHGEAFGFLVAEMQHLQRAYPGLRW
jgi:ring-1,2-phenylacetyl-CoA epoxidase subunit PaaC